MTKLMSSSFCRDDSTQGAAPVLCIQGVISQWSETPTDKNTSSSSIMELVDESTLEGQKRTQVLTQTLDHPMGVNLPRNPWDWIPTLALVTKVPVVAGQELFVDYRFNPRTRAQLPDWYTPCGGGEAASRRWA